MATITVFRNIKDTSNAIHIDHTKIFERIRTGKYKDLVEKIRTETNDKKRNDLKQQLPSILFSGKFSARNAKAIIDHSGLICLDFDKIPTDTMQAVRDTLEADQYTHALFLSPSGNGYKLIVRIPNDTDQHKAYFDGLAKYYDSEYFDKACSDVSRVCYESHDADIYVNEHSVVFTDKLIKEQFTYQEKPAEYPITNESEIFGRLTKWLESSGSYFVQGGRNQYIFKLSSACCRFGINKESAEYLMLQFVSDDFELNELKTTISQGYKANQSAFGSEYFEDKQSLSYARDQIREGKTSEQVIHTLVELRKVEPKLAESIVKKAKLKQSNNNGIFWDVKESKTGSKYSVHRGNFIDWLMNQGIYRYKYTLKQWDLIYIKNNVVEVIAKDDLKKKVFDHIRSFKDDSLFEYFASVVRNVFSDEILEVIDERKVEFVKDRADEVNFYFENKVVTLTKNDIKFSDYDDLNGYIWKSQILSREYNAEPTVQDLERGNESDFARFLFNVSGQDAKRYASMMSVIGFLLHNFKSRSKCPAIILNDETISDNPEGGTGKGIFIRSLQYFKSSESVDGKMFKFDRSFLYQRVNLDTQILAFEDVQQGFDFERLFSVITDGIEVEKKGQDSFYIPFEQSPKIIVTTNYAVRGTGNSHNRRKLELEFAQHYTKTNTPQDEFGRLLFDDWSDDDWDKFDRFMIGCAQVYLSQGLIEAQHVNLEYKKLVASTSQEFIEWMEDRVLSGEINKAQMYKDFTTEYDHIKTWCKPKKFKTWMDIYCENNNIRFEVVKIQGIYYFRF
jgi:hypothetical protein